MKKDKLDGKRTIYKSEAFEICLGTYDYSMRRMLRISNVTGVGMAGRPTYLDLDAIDLSLVADELAAASATIRLLGRKLDREKGGKDEVGEDD